MAEVRFLGCDNHVFCGRVQAHAPEFEQAYGHRLAVQLLENDFYYANKLTDYLGGDSPADVYMSGPVLEWEQLGLGFVRPLDEFVGRAAGTFDLGDFFERLIRGSRWTGRFSDSFAEAMAPGGAIAALTRLRDEGVLGHLGVAGGDVLLAEFIATGLLDVVLCHNRFTLIDRSAEPLMEAARQCGVAFVNAAPYGGGILAQGPDAQPRYAYEPAGAANREAVLAMQAACSAHGVPLAAAALQFSVRDPRVASTVVGVSEPGRIEETAALMAQHVPDELWAELELLPPRLSTS